MIVSGEGREGVPREPRPFVVICITCSMHCAARRQGGLVDSSGSGEPAPTALQLAAPTMSQRCKCTLWIWNTFADLPGPCLCPRPPAAGLPGRGGAPARLPPVVQGALLDGAAAGPQGARGDWPTLRSHAHAVRAELARHRLLLHACFLLPQREWVMFSWWRQQFTRWVLDARLQVPLASAALWQALHQAVSCRNGKSEPRSSSTCQLHTLSSITLAVQADKGRPGASRQHAWSSSERGHARGLRCRLRLLSRHRWLVRRHGSGCRQRWRQRSS